MTWFSASLFSALIRVVFHLQINTKWTFSCRSGGERKVCVQNKRQFNVRSVFMKETWQIKHTKITALNGKEERLVQWAVKKNVAIEIVQFMMYIAVIALLILFCFFFFFFFQVREVALADLKASRAHPNKKRDVWSHRVLRLCASDTCCYTSPRETEGNCNNLWLSVPEVIVSAGWSRLLLNILLPLLMFSHEGLKIMT